MMGFLNREGQDGKPEKKKKTGEEEKTWKKVCRHSQSFNRDLKGTDHQQSIVWENDR